MCSAEIALRDVVEKGKVQGTYPLAGEEGRSMEVQLFPSQDAHTCLWLCRCTHNVRKMYSQSQHVLPVGSLQGIVVENLYPPEHTIRQTLSAGSMHVLYRATVILKITF